MILLIDIGNTNTVCAVHNNEKYIAYERIDCEDKIQKKINMFYKYNITRIAISSVVPNLTDKLFEYLKQTFKITPFIVSYKNCNIKLDVNSKSEVGSDRICNVRGAIEITKKNALVIDFGTATTYDVINDNQEFIGGAISPGIDVSAEYLIQKAALLKNTTFTFPKKIISKNTKTNIQSGVMFGALYSIEGMINNIKLELKSNPYIILTGGFSKLISPKLTYQHILEPNLTLDGIRLIYNDNQ